MASNKKTEKQNKAFALNEAFLRLRSNIEFSGVDNTMQVVNVVSTNANEGKSTVSTNLAIAYAKKYDKETTNEQDFIVKVIAKHFPKCQYKKDFDVIGTNGWTNIPNNEYEFKENTDNGFANLVIFDADEDFETRRKELLAYKEEYGVEFELFLLPNNKDAGELENLLENIINPNNRPIFDCWENYEQELVKLDIPGRTPPPLTTPALPVVPLSYSLLTRSLRTMWRKSSS